MNEYVQGKVGLPGIALAVIGLFSIFTHLALGAITLLSAVSVVLQLLSGDVDSASWMSFLTGTGWQLVLFAVYFFASFIVTFAGMRLRNARSAGIVYLGALIAIVPCCAGACWCFGLPVGIWAIVVMQDPQVKAAFAETF